jgi:transposase-like protein
MVVSSGEHHLAGRLRVLDIGGMSRTRERREFWRQLIAQQEQNGVSMRAFCQQQRISEHTFYQWHKRLGEQLPVKFALLERNRSAPAATGVEVILSPASDCASHPVPMPPRFGWRWCVARAAMMHLSAGVRV